jgi:hypothetical protein
VGLVSGTTKATRAPAAISRAEGKEKRNLSEKNWTKTPKKVPPKTVKKK